MYIKSSVSLTLAAICGLMVPTQANAISENSESQTHSTSSHRIQVQVKEQPWSLSQGNSPAYLADASESSESDDASESEEETTSDDAEAAEMEYDEGSVDELETEALVEKLNSTGVEFDETEVDSLEYDILMETPDNPPETDSD